MMENNKFRAEVLYYNKFYDNTNQINEEVKRIMIKDYKITTCGLNCDICDANTTKIQDSANYLLDVFKDSMFLDILSMTNPKFKQENFPAFKEVLEVLNKFPPCPGCEKRKDCVINLCAMKKKIENCSECNQLDVENFSCIALPETSEIPFMPPSPIFFNGLVKRYQQWNVENLKSIQLGNKSEINEKISQMIKEGKTNRDVLDRSINLFDQMKK